MKCPIDNADLVMSERQNIEIDYCPQCRGIWLDRGELDKIIERLEREAAPQPDSRGSQAAAMPQEPPRPQQPHYQPSHDQRRPYDDDDYHQPHHRKKHRESWLGELFD